MWERTAATTIHRRRPRLSSAADQRVAFASCSPRKSEPSAVRSVSRMGNAAAAAAVAPLSRRPPPLPVRKARRHPHGAGAGAADSPSDEASARGSTSGSEVVALSGYRRGYAVIMCDFCVWGARRAGKGNSRRAFNRRFCTPQRRRCSPRPRLPISSYAEKLILVVAVEIEASARFKGRFWTSSRTPSPAEPGRSRSSSSRVVVGKAGRRASLAPSCRSIVLRSLLRLSHLALDLLQLFELAPGPRGGVSSPRHRLRSASVDSWLPTPTARRVLAAARRGRRPMASPSAIVKVAMVSRPARR